MAGKFGGSLVLLPVFGCRVLAIFFEKKLSKNLEGN